MRAHPILQTLATLTAALVVVPTLCLAPALGAEPTIREAAVIQANAGIEALTAGRWFEAVRELEKALPLATRSGDRTLIAGCHRALAKAHDGLEAYDAALRHYRAYLAVGVDEPLKRKEVEDRVEVLEQMRETRVFITVDALDAALTIDGEPSRLSDEPLRLAPGRHTVRVTAPGFEPHEEQIALTGGQTLQLAIRMRPRAAAPPTTPVVADPAKPHVVHHQGPAPAGASPWPWVTLGLGAVAGGVGAWLIVDGTSDWQAVTDAQDDPVSMSREQADGLVEDGDRKRTIGFIAAGVGGALVVGSIILFLLEGSDDANPEAEPGLTFSPLISARTAGFSVGAGF